MVRTDRTAFSELMLKMSLTCRGPKLNETETTLMLEAYFEALERYHIEEVRRAVNERIRESGRVFWPTPGELIEGILSDRRRIREETESRRMLAPMKEPTAEERAVVDGLLAEIHTRFKL